MSTVDAVRRQIAAKGRLFTLRRPKPGTNPVQYAALDVRGLAVRSTADQLTGGQVQTRRTLTIGADELNVAGWGIPRKGWSGLDNGTSFTVEAVDPCFVGGVFVLCRLSITVNA
ncbi:hypothetical protein MHL39_10870 [Roseomonas mucosa]|uniref:hypothetical protein n=1 Tax=Roseomonas mucosa TaxID=207340 RepID=UPI001EF51200|nr:hypothetical protein [Roseomonas mucosa]MCG7357141.1 hypothetical protein [Roseomonas mucosa]